MVTTLNLEWQRHAEKVLRDKCRRGAFVLIDARHGLHYAHRKQHLALYPIYRGDEQFEAAVGPYRAKTDSVHFSHAQPLPLGVIEVIATALAARD